MHLSALRRATAAQREGVEPLAMDGVSRDDGAQGPPMTKHGDVWRIRRCGSKDSWCICSVVIVSGNGLSVGLRVIDGRLNTAHGGMMLGTLAVMIDPQAGTATEIFTRTELEVEERDESKHDA